MGMHEGKPRDIVWLRVKPHPTEGVKETIKDVVRKDNDKGANRKGKERDACGMLHGVPQG